MKNEKKGKEYKTIFLFDLDKEMAIYFNLCNEKINKKQKKLIEGYEFDTYAEWEKYITSKYEPFSIKSLNEFSRFLNHQVRRRFSIRSFLAIFITALITIIITSWFDIVFSGKFLFNVCVGCIIFGFLFNRMLFQDIKDKVESSFFEDYKEIIDKIIEKKLR